MSELAELRERLRVFTNERDWARYHTPKNLILALVGEMGELAELFQWLTEDESAGPYLDETTRAAVREELADILIYLVRLADVLEIDLADAANEKIEQNALRYPAAQVRGSAAKRP